MELEVLRKKLSSFKTEGGKTKNVSDDLLLEILSAWEHWGGSAIDFYRGIGSNNKSMAALLRKAKRLKREGATMPFSEVKFDDMSASGPDMASFPCDIEVQDHNKVIRFRKVDLLIEYLKKVA